MKDQRRLGVAELGRLVRFALVGLAALIVYWLVTNALASAFGIGLIVASLAGHLAAGVVSYTGHLFFSFRVPANHADYGPKFLIVALLGLAVNVAMIRGSSAFGIPASLATLLVGVTIPVMNYVFNRLWVFASGIEAVNVPEKGI